MVAVYNAPTPPTGLVSRLGWTHALNLRRYGYAQTTYGRNSQSGAFALRALAPRPNSHTPGSGSGAQLIIRTLVRFLRPDHSTSPAWQPYPLPILILDFSPAPELCIAHSSFTSSLLSIIAPGRPIAPSPESGQHKRSAFLAAAQHPFPTAARITSTFPLPPSKSRHPPPSLPSSPGNPTRLFISLPRSLLTTPSHSSPATTRPSS